MERAAADSGARSSADDDARLFAAYAGGDARAFETLYRKHRAWLYRAILRQVRDEGRAQEVFQEVWLTAIRLAPEWTPQARFTTWLYGIARSRVIDSWRALKPDSSLHPSRSTGPAGSAADADQDDDPMLRVADGSAAGDPARVHEQRELGRRLLRALDEMPPLQREAFLLAVDAGLSLPEVARATGSTLEAAKSRLRYARARLADALAEWRR